MGEILFHQFAQKQSSELAPELGSLVRAENQQYLLRSAKALLDALKEEDPPYNYNWNYPLARLAALFVFEQSDQDETAAAMTGDIAIDHLIIRLNDWKPTDRSFLTA